MTEGAQQRSLPMRIDNSEPEQQDGGFRRMVTCLDPGGIGGVTDDAPFSGEPYIFCDRVPWRVVKVG